MDFQTIMFVFGAILFLVGLVGHIKAKELEVGSSSKAVRVSSFFLGIAFIILSFVYPFHKTSEKEINNTSDRIPTPEINQAPKNIENSIADATFIYWEKCQENDTYYKNLLEKEDAAITKGTSSNKILGEANLRKGKILKEYLKSEGNISTANVDKELVEYFRRLRDLHYQRANYFERIGDVLLSIGDSPDAATINLANQRINAVVAEDNRLQLNGNQLNIERESLKERLSRKYGREFVDRN